MLVQPGGAMVAVHSRTPDGVRYLFLHNCEYAVGSEGDWAWGSPSGCREPGEDIADCAARELVEETGIVGVPVPVATTDIGWAVYHLEVPWPTAVVLDPEEHNDFAWLELTDARTRCRPSSQAASFEIAVAALPTGSDSGDESG